MIRRLTLFASAVAIASAGFWAGGIARGIADSAHGRPCCRIEPR